MLDILQGIVIAILLLLASYTDIKTGKVRNNHLLLFGLILGLLQLNRYFTGRLTVSYYLLNLVLTVGFAFMLWIEEVIPAGDSKLLIIIGLGMPLHFYSMHAPTIFPMSMVFVLCFILPLLQSILQVVWKRTIPKIEFVSDLFMMSYIAYAFIMFLIKLIELMGYNISMILFIFAYVFVLRIAMKYLTGIVKYRKTTAIVLTALNLYYYDPMIYVAQSFAFSILLVALIQMMEAIFREAFTKVIPVGKLKPGMVLADIIVKEKGKYKAIPNMHFAKSDPIFTCDAEGIEKADLKELKKYMKSYRIYQELPLAPYIAISVIVLIVLSI